MNKYIKVKQIGEGSFGKAILVKKADTDEKLVVKVSLSFNYFTLYFA